jgi:hypothetical protein
MKRNFFLLVALFSLILSILGCSLLGGGDEDENGGTDTGSTEPTQVVIDQPEPTETPEFEEGIIDLDSIWGTEDIKSYRGGFTMSFDGTAEGEMVNGSINMSIEYTTNPPAQHITMNLEGYDIDPELAGFNSFEFYVMEDTTYLNMGGEMGWTAFPNDPEESVADEFMFYQEFVDLPEKAKRKLLPENVNGVNSWHYVIDAEDLPEEIANYDEVTADAWIAVDGGYLVKMDLTMKGTFTSEDLGDQPIDEGTINIVFNMRDVNGNFTIELPPEATSAEPFSFDDEMFEVGEWTREDVPLPEDAEIDFAMEGMVYAFTNLSYDETLEFMNTQLVANGWVVEGEPMESEAIYWIDYVKDGETLGLIIEPADDGTDRISIMVTIE